MAIVATSKEVGLRVVHPTWVAGRDLHGTILSVPNRWHAVINTPLGRLTAAQASLVWAQDFKKAQR